ncbi:Zinc finger, HIT-type [Corchorus olitorius]|uniref:Zinc finger, HIT-type n=1 Tax=Corchorus olitorius TaxID=93759 RepID=A0A1R3K5F9_9ROSI|nr:Zinc finger, HIT-type [Corchorus olitorius]
MTKNSFNSQIITLAIFFVITTVAYPINGFEPSSSRKLDESIVSGDDQGSVKCGTCVAALARLEALENDNAAIEPAEMNDDDEASLDDDDQAYMQKKAKGTKRKTRQAKALENARRAPRTFLELLHEANLESLPPHVPSYLRAAVGPPSSSSRRHYCTVCGFTATYTCVTCGMRFCSYRCQNIHNDTRCMKFVA